MKVSLLTGGGEKHYQLGLLSGLISNEIEVDFIGNDDMRHVEMYEDVNYYNLRGDQNPHSPLKEKIWRVLKYYFKLIKYAAKTDSNLFHIQWLNKFIYFDRTILNVYYKLLGKKLVFTVHNVNAAERDENDSPLNRLTLRFIYKIVDHIIVHTEKMKLQLMENYDIAGNKITVIPHGINNAVFKSELTCKQAKRKLDLNDSQKVLLYFGQIAPYKGLEYLILALVKEKAKNNNYRLIIAGRIRKGDCQYWKNIEGIMEEHDLKNYIIGKIQFIPDEEVEIYFKAADVLILPYKNIFQSGVLFLSYSFGLPVVATDVGSLREDVIEGKTGYICEVENLEDLTGKIDLYFNSDLFKNLERNRQKIIDWANEKYSWRKVGEITYGVYKALI